MPVDIDKDLKALIPHDPEHDPDDELDAEYLMPIVRPDANSLDSETLTSYNELQDLIRGYALHLRPNVVRAIVALASGAHANSLTAIARDFRTTKQTLVKALETPDGKGLYIAQSKMTRMLHGPIRAQKIAMAWRIAIANELTAPRISLQALDYLSKTSGDYVTTAEDDNGVTVIVQQFTNGQYAAIGKIEPRTATPNVGAPEKATFSRRVIDVPSQRVHDDTHNNT